MTNPDTLIHVFRTFMGMPPDTDTSPVCGAVLTKDYEKGGQRPQCAECNAIRDAWLRTLTPR